MKLIVVFSLLFVAVVVVCIVFVLFIFYPFRFLYSNGFIFLIYTDKRRKARIFHRTV